MDKDREEAFGAMLEDLNAANFDDSSLMAAGMHGEKTFVHIMADDDLVVLLTAVFASVCVEIKRDPYELALLCAAFTSEAKRDRFIEERGKLNHDTIRN